MEEKQLSIILSRVLSGSYIFTYNNRKFNLKYPNVSIKYEADIFAEEEREKAKFNSWIQPDDILYFLIDCGIWTRDGDVALSSLSKQIDDHKVELYKNHLNPVRIKQIRQKLVSTKKNYNNLFNKRHSLDYITLDGYIDNIKDQYLCMRSLYYIDGTKVFDDTNNIDIKLLTSLSNYIAQNTISIDTFRQLARSQKWRNYWSCNKDNIFDKATTEWTDEQQTLVLMSRMYDSVYEHPECPSDKIIEDDDMLDGWLIIQREENEKNKQKNRAEKMLKDKNLGNAKEIFLVANSQEEAEEIYSLNDPNSRRIIQERNKIIMNAKADIKEAELPDVQRDMTMKMNQQFVQSRRK